MTDQNTGSPYIIFVLVFCFFIMGLLGFIICHMLKEKGYRCRRAESENEDCKNTFGPDSDDESEDNQDTVEKILKCIIENEANLDAFSEMLGNQNPSEQRDLRSLRKESLQGIPLHHHTIHLGSIQNFCHHCGQGHPKKTQRRNHMVRSKGRPGEQTVFSVGRFRVTHMEKKNSLQDPTNLPINESRDHPDHTAPLNSETRMKDTPKTIQESYNIRNMFKGIEATNAIVPNASKRKKSVTLLGLRKDSDTVSSKENQRTAERDTLHETSDQFPTPSKQCLGSDQVPDTNTEGISHKKFFNTNSLKTLEEKINMPPESKQANKTSSTKSEIEEMKIVKARPDSLREFSMVHVEETSSTTAVSAEEQRVTMVHVKSLGQ
ncbi:RELT-like protein 2 [Colossoma macropomum]|uniref:RELT-like protein 2 n=1 Tax=Colossoma macropomum TaxID=42526 RepID=UPI001863EF71|nr:RELT-like protein 2 [Colossoma macropomum]XP_036425072.1 RELT-like protein 2 [Colossoma macropomum]